MPQSSAVFFDEWTFHRESGELEKEGVRVRLQDLPLQILNELLVRPGEMVTRAALIAKLWPTGVIDFDTSLNSAVRKLRAALDDDADSPRYIETVPRRGYRFIGKIAEAVPIAAVRQSGEAHAAHQEVSHHKGPWLAVVFGAIGMFAIAVAIGVRFFGMGGSGSAHVTPSQAAAPSAVTTTVTSPPFNPPAHSIAVLPFVNMSGDPQQEYFSDGMAEELLNSLVRISELKVAARTSAFAFKGKEMEIADIARKLNVGAILEGSVRRSGKQVRITVQLVDATNGYHLWSQSYDREVDDTFEVQADIASNVVRQLQATLLGNLKSPRHTPSIEAYAAYLQGNYFFLQSTQWDKATTYLERALQLDDHYAEAMVSLARLRFGNLIGGRSDAAVEKARELVARALALDPQLASGYAMRSRIERAYDFDWAAAEVSAKRARELEPGNIFVLREAGLLADTLGRYDEAFALHRQVLERDPLHRDSYLSLGIAHMNAGRLEIAEADFRNALELVPQSISAHYLIALTQLLRKDAEKALAEAQLEPMDSLRLSAVAMAHHSLGHKAESDKALRELTEKYASEAAFRIAECHAYRGEVDEAMRWLEQARRNHEAGIARMLAAPLLATLHRDPRFKAFLRKLNLPTDVVHPFFTGTGDR